MFPRQDGECQRRRPRQRRCRTNLFIYPNSEEENRSSQRSRQGLHPRTPRRETHLLLFPSRGSAAFVQAFSVPRKRPKTTLYMQTSTAVADAPCFAASGLVLYHGSLTLGAQRCQRLFHSLSKVLFIFRSHYLFAIGLGAIFSLRRSTPPD